MNEKIIDIGSVNPVDLLGPNDLKLSLIKDFFPNLKIIARGTKLKLLGTPEDIQLFEEKLDLLIRHLNKYNQLTEGNIETLMMESGHKALEESAGDDVLVHGNNGLKIKAKTANQRRMVQAMSEDDMLFAIGPAGTGKTYTAVAIAVRALKNREVRRIILTRPAVEAGENLGFLPGDLKEKLDPYLQPLYDALRDMIPHEKLYEYLDQGIIQIAPLAFMRGRTLDNAYVILDEAQNATEAQLKMFLTRMGQSARFIITGDTTQIDLPPHQPSGLIKALQVLNGVDGISIVRLTGKDVIRHKLVQSIIKAYDKKTNDKITNNN